MKITHFGVEKAAFIGIFVIFVAAGLTQSLNVQKTELPIAQDLSPHLTFGNVKIDVLVSKTEAEREIGLGSRAALDPSQGMFFVFPESGVYTFWMKDMLFAIDIFWLDEKCRIVYMVENAAPDTNATMPKIYTSDKTALYVLETNAGFAKKNNLKIGDVCVLPAKY